MRLWSLNQTKSVLIQAQNPWTHYDGADDPNLLERWFFDLLQYLQSGNITQAGAAHERLRINTACSYLSGEAFDWFRNEVSGPSHLVSTWTFKEVIFELARRFMRESSTIDAEWHFNNVIYDSEGGARALINEMNKYATRMTERPSSYHMSSRFLTGLPTYMRNELVERQGYRPTHHIQELLRAAFRIENGRLFNQRMVAVNSNAPDRPNNPANPRNSSKLTSSSSRSRDRNKASSSSRPRDSQSSHVRPRDAPPTVTRSREPVAATSTSSQARPTRPPARDKGRDVCNSCRQTGHWKNDPACPNWKGKGRQARKEGSLLVDERDLNALEDPESFDGSRYEDRKEVPSHDGDYDDGVDFGEKPIEASVHFEDIDEEDEYAPSASIRGMRICAISPLKAHLNRLAPSPPDGDEHRPKAEPLYGGQIRPKKGRTLQPIRTPTSQHCMNGLTQRKWDGGLYTN